jgi:hypothetical protein
MKRGPYKKHQIDLSHTIVNIRVSRKAWATAKNLGATQGMKAPEVLQAAINLWTATQTAATSLAWLT